MLGSVLVFFIMSYFLNVLLSKDAEETQYSSYYLLLFLALYFFLHLSDDGLVDYIPVFISILLLFVTFTLGKGDGKKGGRFGN